MGKAAYFFTLCFTSLAVFIFIYWAIGWLLFYKTGNLKEVRMLAASQLSETLENNLPEECLNMGLKADQIKNCSFETKKHIKGEETITVKSTIQVEEKKGTQVGIKIQHEIKDGPDYLTEAGFCGTDQCSKFKTTEVDKLSETIWSMLNEADSQINKAANENYHAIKKQEELEERITNCEISKDSTIDKIVELTQAKEQKCQINDLIAQLTQQKPEEKTLSFHYDVKERLWNIVAQNRPNQDFFLQEYVKKLQAPGFFDHQQFSIQSSFSLMEKYQEFRLFMDHLNRQKQSVGNELIQQLPDYFSTDIRNPYAESDEMFLKRAWMKNFQQPNSLNYDRIFNERHRERKARSIEEFRSMLQHLYSDDYTHI